MPKLKLLFILICICQLAAAQGIANTMVYYMQKVDSLKALPKSFARDTNLVNFMISIGQKEYDELDSQKGINHIKEALMLSESINWDSGRVKSQYFIAEGEHVKGHYFSSVKDALTLLTFIDKSKFSEKYMQTIRLIAGSYMWMEQPYESAKYYKLFLKELPKNKVKATLLSDIYVEIGILNNKYLQKPNAATYFFNKALSIYHSKNDPFGLAYANTYLGLIYEKQKMPAKAEVAFDFAITTFRKYNANYMLPDALNNAAQYYERKGDHFKAENMANEALKVSKKVKSFYGIRDANLNLYRIKSGLGDNKAAILNYIGYATARDSMSQANIDDKLKVIKYDYNTALHKAEIEKKTSENQKQNSLIFGLIAGLFALAIIGGLFYRNSNIRKNLAEREVKQLHQEKQIIATNAVIKGQEEERSRLAKDLHDGLGGILSGVKFSLNTMNGNVILSEQNAGLFNRAIGQLDTAITELRRVAHSMMPEALLKFGLVDALNDFCENITQSGQLKVYFQAIGLSQRLEQSVEITIFRIVQELLNNTMKHAEATEAQVQLNEHENLITITVEDNGRGFDIHDLEKIKGNGIANVRSRAQYLNGSVDIQSEPTIGTSVVVIFEKNKI